MSVVLIYENPDAYFFRYMNNVYSPYAVRYHSFFYWVYRGLYLCHFPFLSAFWGEWKKKISSAEKVIIFDYGYQRGMERYIKKINPTCEVYLYYWNPIDCYRNHYRYFSNKDKIYSSDITDCKKYNFRYNSIFYIYNQSTRSEKKGVGVFFAGADKGRAELLLNLKNYFDKIDYPVDIRMLSLSEDKEYKDRYKKIIVHSSLNYEEYMALVEKAEIILDITQGKQSAFTMRVVESVFCGKKLITNNKNIVNSGIYEYGNVFLLDPDSTGNPLTGLEEFIDKDYTEYDEKIKQELGYEAWLNRFQ